MDLSKYDNSWYDPGRNFVVRSLWFVVNAVFLCSGLFPFSRGKVWLLRLFGAKVGCGVVIKPRVNIKYPWNLTIGDHTWIGEGVWIDNLALVTIGSNCCLSQGAMLLCGNHNYKDKYFGLFVKPIVLGDETWIGAQSLVCPGSEMGTGAVLAVRSVLRGKAEAGWIYDGNPAVKIRQRKELV